MYIYIFIYLFIRPRPNSAIAGSACINAKESEKEERQVRRAIHALIGDEENNGKRKKETRRGASEKRDQGIERILPPTPTQLTRSHGMMNRTKNKKEMEWAPIPATLDHLVAFIIYPL